MRRWSARSPSPENPATFIWRSEQAGVPNIDMMPRAFHYPRHMFVNEAIRPLCDAAICAPRCVVVGSILKRVASRWRFSRTR
jgi:hypothetical protein